MKFSCTRDNLSSALSLVSTIANKNNNLPILGNVLIKVDNQKVEIIATNLELAIVVNLRSKIEDIGSFTIPARTLTDYINLLSEEKIDLELKDSELLINCGKSSTKIKGTSADEFPIIPSVNEGQGFLLEANELKKGLSQVMSSTAKNDIRPELSGVYFGFNNNGFAGLIMAATDSYRLAEKKIKLLQGQEEFKIIIPNRAAQEMGHILSLAKDSESEKNVRILLSSNQIVLHYNNVQMISRLVEGQYPDYTQIIPKEFKTEAECSTNKLTKEIKAASLFTTTGVNAISFKIHPDKQNIEIASTSTQTGEYNSEISSDIKGEDNNILLNFRYLLDGLNNIDTEKCSLKVINGDSACVLSPGGVDDYLYIIMPIRQ